MRNKLGLLRISILAFLIVGILSIIPLESAFATDDPNSTPTISNIHANTYLIEEGDVLIYFDYDIPYATVPDEPASDTYTFRLLDGEEEIGMIVPYVMMDNGYNKGVSSFYFSATDNLTWDTAYTIRISQNPSYFNEPESWDYTMPFSAYSDSDEQEDNQTEVAINIISAAQRLEVAHSDYAFLDSSVGGTVLSSPTGETYFRGAIYGIQAMAPSLFLVQTLDIDVTDREWGTEYSENLSSRFSGTWVGTAVEATETQFNLTGGAIMGMIFTFPLCIGSMFLSSMKFSKIEPGLAVSALLLEMALLMGWVPTALFATIYQAMGIYIAYVWFYSRG